MADVTLNHFKKPANYSSKELALTVGSLAFTDGTTQTTAGGGGGGSTAQFLTLVNDAELTDERAFVAGTALAGVDSGAGLAYTLNLGDTAVTPAAYTSADITVNQQGRITAVASGVGESQFQDEGFFYRIRVAAPASITNNAWTPLAWGADVLHTGPYENNPGPFNFASGEFTPPFAGYYTISFSGDFAANATGQRSVRIWDQNAGSVAAEAHLNNPSATEVSQVTVMAIHVELRTNDEILFQVRQTSGGNLDSNNSLDTTYAGITYLGPL